MANFPLLTHLSSPLGCLNGLHKKHGDIFRMDSGEFPTVWLCKFEDLEEAFKKDILSDRPQGLMPGVVRKHILKNVSIS